MVVSLKRNNVIFTIIIILVWYLPSYTELQSARARHRVFVEMIKKNESK